MPYALITALIFALVAMGGFLKGGPCRLDPIPSPLLFRGSALSLLRCSRFGAFR
jgi:hypothetical protein